jgi:hypothetical protein
MGSCRQGDAMTRRMTAGAVLLAALWTPNTLAHEGHAHKVVGTVTAVQQDELEVKTTAGKVSTITLNEKTKIWRGKVAIEVAEIKTGERVSITEIQTKDKNDKPTFVATEVRVGSFNPAVPK